MKKQLLFAVLVLAVATTSFVSARQGADDPAGHIRQEDRRADRQENRRNDDKKTVKKSKKPKRRSSSSFTTSSSSRTLGTQQVRLDDGPHRSSGHHSSTDDSSNSSGATSNSGTQISSSQAVAIAQGVFPGKVFEEVEMEFEHGVNVYKVEFTDDSRVDVSIADGSILRVRDRADD